MKRINLTIFLLVVLFLSGCTGYKNATDISKRQVYSVFGRVQDSFHNPIHDCEIFLIKVKRGTQVSQGVVEMLPVAVTDISGNYHFAFELDGFSEFWIYFDAEKQDFIKRYVSLSEYLESNLFQYTGNSPVIVNALLLRKLENYQQYPPMTDRLPQKSGN